MLCCKILAHLITFSYAAAAKLSGLEGCHNRHTSLSDSLNSISCFSDLSCSAKQEVSAQYVELTSFHRDMGWECTLRIRLDLRRGAHSVSRVNIPNSHCLVIGSCCKPLAIAAPI